MIYFLFIGYLAAILALGYWTNLLLAKSFPINFYRFLVAPGVILHELSHVLFCALTGAKVRRITLFSKKGGEVLHGPSKIPIVGQMLISLAPLAGGTLALYFTTQFFVPEILTYQNQIGLDSKGLSQLLLASFKNFSRLNYTNWQDILYLYLVLSFAAAMAPSKQDLQHIYWSLGLILIILVAASFLFPDFRLVFLNLITQASGFYLFGLGMLIFAFLIAFFIYFLIWARRVLI